METNQQGKFIHYLNEYNNLVLRVGIALAYYLFVLSMSGASEAQMHHYLWHYNGINNFNVHRLFFKFLGLIFLCVCVCVCVCVFVDIQSSLIILVIVFEYLQSKLYNLNLNLHIMASSSQHQIWKGLYN